MLLAASLVCAGAAAGEPREPEAESAGDAVRMQALYRPFQQLLDLHLVKRELPSGGLVSAFRYGEALDDPRTAVLLRRQNARLARFDPARLDTREAAVAFWVNAYNYFMIAYLLDNPRGDGPVDSVRDYGSLFNPYRVFRRSVFDVGGRLYSLSEIENDILLGEEFRERGWKEARVHFAVNCASVGCPPLRAGIYLPETLDGMLTDSTRRSLSTDLHLRVDGDTLYLSSLFDWYENDYVEEHGSVESFILAYADPRIREEVKRTRRVRHIDYDWRLNAPQNFPQFAGD